MKVYGSNLLKRALRVQGTSSIEYYRFKENRIDPSGVELPIYAPAVKLQASV